MDSLPKNRFWLCVSDTFPDLNKMKGSLPSVIFELTALEKIHLARNDLTGTLPDSISNMQNLKFIDLGKWHDVVEELQFVEIGEWI
jgi:hypothetical protein